MSRQSFLRQWIQQFGGVLMLTFLVWAFLNTPDQKGWNVAVSALLAISALALGSWLVITNFTGAGTISWRRFLGIAGCLIALLGLLILLADAQEAWSGRISAWIASAATLARKKPLTPMLAAEWIDWAAFLIRWVALPLLFIPLMMRVAGMRPARYRRFVLVYLAAFLLGAVVPHYLVHWVPKLVGFWPQVVSAAVRFLVAYMILITAWVLLGLSTREAAPR